MLASTLIVKMYVLYLNKRISSSVKRVWICHKRTMQHIFVVIPNCQGSKHVDVNGAYINGKNQNHAAAFVHPQIKDMISNCNFQII